MRAGQDPKWVQLVRLETFVFCVFLSGCAFSDPEAPASNVDACGAASTFCGEPDADARDGPALDASIDEPTPEGQDADAAYADAADSVVDSSAPGDASEVGDGLTADRLDAPDTSYEDARDAGDGPAEADRSNDGGDGAIDAGPTCQDGKKNAQETDVDCGGPTCRACEISQACLANRDCRTSNCSFSMCGLATGPPFWKTGVPMKTPRSRFAAVMQPFGNRQGRIMVIGGSCGTGCDLDSYETFDTRGNTWTTGTLPAARSQGMAVTDTMGRVYYVDGQGLWRFDGTWDTKFALPISNVSSCGVAFGSDGLLYTFGASASPRVDTYDPFADRWSNLPTHSAHAFVIGAAAIGQLIYVVADTAVGVDAIESFDIVSGGWSTLRSAPQNEVDLDDAVALGPDGRFYVGGGGYTYSDGGKSVIAYSTVTNQWSRVAPLSVEHNYGAAAVGPDGRIYMLGSEKTTRNDAGAFVDIFSAAVEIYGPVGVVTPESAAPGAEGVVIGQNFAANAEVSVYLGPIGGTLLGKGATNGTGGIAPAISFRVPDVPPAETFITVVDDLSRYPITLPFVVTRPPSTD